MNRTHSNVSNKMASISFRSLFASFASTLFLLPEGESTV